MNGGIVYTGMRLKLQSNSVTLLLVWLTPLFLAACSVDAVTAPASILARSPTSSATDVSPSSLVLSPPVPTPTPSLAQASLTVDAAPALPIASSSGPLKNANWISYPSLNDIRSLVLAPDDSLWAGTGGGLSRFDGQDWQYVLSDANVRALAVASDGSLWTGVGCEVRRFDGLTWETMARCEEDLPVGNVLDIVLTADGAAWVASGFVLARFDGQSWTSYEKLANSLVLAPDGAIWINGWEGLASSFYVARFDGQSWTTYEGVDSHPGGFMIGAVTSDGLVWGIVPERRLACFDGQSWADSRSWTYYSTADGLPSDQVLDLVVAPDDVLWAITEGGIAYFDGAAWEGIPLDHDLGTVRAMAFAPDGSIWLGTSKGAVHLQP